MQCSILVQLPQAMNPTCTPIECQRHIIETPKLPKYLELDYELYPSKGYTVHSIWCRLATLYWRTHMYVGANERLWVDDQLHGC